MTESSGSAPERLQKKVDESWKDSVHKEAAPEPEASAAESALPPVDFLVHVSGLAYQAMIWMGLVPHPADGKPVEANLPQAKFFIDTVEMLLQKTQGNLSAEERAEAEALLYELRVRFLEKQTGITR